MASTRHQLTELIEQDCIPADKIHAAVAATDVLPDGKAWLRFIDHLLLWLGGLALTFSAMFFIAYNWIAFGRFTKFAMVEALIALSILVYWKLDRDKMAAKVALFMATLFLGVLLALYGQTYQTGADPWQLFFTWALLMLPWTIIARFPALWILWITLLNLAILLYHMALRNSMWFMFNNDSNILWILFAFNTLALFVWELSAIKWHWLSERWAARLIAIGSGFPLSWLVIISIVDSRHANAFSVIVWIVWIGGLYFVYRTIKRDLFMLAGVALTAIVVSTSFFAKHLISGLEAGGFLVLTIIVIGMGTGAAIWLHKIHREWQS